MARYQISLPFYVRFFRSVTSPKDFCWKARRECSSLWREAYASAVAPFFFRQSMGSVAMFHLGRSGSTVLGDLLDQHPDIFWDSEIYLPEYHKCFYSRQKNAVFDPFTLFESRRQRSGMAYYGFESKTTDQEFMNCSVDDFIHGLAEANVKKFILLRRANLLRIAASFQLAYKKRAFHVWKHEQPQLRKIRLLEIDKGMGIKKPLLEQLHQWTAELQRLETALQGHNLLELNYESDIETDPLIALRKVTDFLELPPLGNPSINLKRANPFPLRDFVEDFEQVITVLQGTPYEHLAHTP